MQPCYCKPGKTRQLAVMTYSLPGIYSPLNACLDTLTRKRPNIANLDRVHRLHHDGMSIRRRNMFQLSALLVKPLDNYSTAFLQHTAALQSSADASTQSKDELDDFIQGWPLRERYTLELSSARRRNIRNHRWKTTSLIIHPNPVYNLARKGGSVSASATSSVSRLTNIYIPIGIFADS